MPVSFASSFGFRVPPQPAPVAPLCQAEASSPARQLPPSLARSLAGQAIAEIRAIFSARADPCFVAAVPPDRLSLNVGRFILQPALLRRIRPLATAILLLLAGCSGGTSGLALSRPGLDVARAALHGGSPQVALQVTNDLLSKRPNDEQALILQADALTTLGQFDQAALDYAAVLKRDPASVDAHIGLGRLRLATDPTAAEALFLEALQNDSRNTTALNDLGIARDLQGHHAAAQHAYAKALGIDPELRATQVNLALSLAMTGDSKHAISILQPLASEPRASRKLWHDLAAVLAMGRKLSEAERILSADLTPPQIQQALDDYQAARTGGPVPLPPDVPEAAAPTAPPPGASPPPAARPPSATAPAATTELPGPQVQFTAAPSKRAAQAEWQRQKG